MNDICFYQTKEIKSYTPVLERLLDDFGYEFWHYILTWCGVVSNEPKDFGKYWQVWLIESQKRVVGVCGIYSNKHHDNTEMWIGWFGIESAHRGRQIGSGALEFLQVEAKRNGAKVLKAYIYPDFNDPLKFYEKNGFQLINTPINSEYEGYFLVQKEISV